MNHLQIQEKTPFPVYLTIISLPFLIFYSVLPFVSDILIGNDYLKSNISHQLEFMFSLKTGSFPLYAPGFAGGHSSSALTMGQIFHPFSYIASILPGYWDGKAIEWITFIKLLSLGITQLILFAFLRKLRLNDLIAFLLSFITVYNLKLLDMFRHGASLEAYTGHFILCAVIGWYFIRPSKWAGPLLIIVSTWLLLLGGHAEEIYYGMIAAVFFALVAPYFLSAMLPEIRIDFKIARRFWVNVGFCIFLGVLLSSLFILPFYLEFLLMNVDRVSKSYAFANRSLDTFIGTLNNFFLPLRADLNTAFGGSSLILIPILLPLLKIFKIKIPRSVWVIWGMILFLFLHVQGDRTPVHELVWRYFPLASSVRSPGRISIIMPFFIMLVSAWIIKVEPSSEYRGRLFASLQPITILSSAAAIIMAVYYLLYLLGFHLFEWPLFTKLFRPYLSNFRKIPFFWVEMSVFITGLLSLLAVVYYGLRDNAARTLGLCLIAVIILQTGVLVKYRAVNWIEGKHDSPSFMEMQQQKRNKLEYLYYPITGFYSTPFKAQLSNSFVEPSLSTIYTHVKPVRSQVEAYNLMHQVRKPHQVFIEGYDGGKAGQLTERARNMKEGKVELLYSSFNRVEVHVSSEAPAILGLSYPYSGKWRAWVNNKSVIVYRANGAAHAVEIPAGESVVEFRYWSNAYFLGFIISCVTFALIGLFVCYRGLSGKSRTAGMIIAVILSSGVFMLWYNSLYSGDNLETEYIWTYKPPAQELNLAYGKKNWLDPSIAAPPLALHDRDLEIYSGLMVDGDRGSRSGFTTRLVDDPAWILDLHQPEKIKRIILYESEPLPTMNSGPVQMLEFFENFFHNYPELLEHNSKVNLRPLEIETSNNGIEWQSVTSIESPPDYSGPLSIVVDPSLTARYIRISASGECKLSFDEVEIYGPKDAI